MTGHQPHPGVDMKKLNIEGFGHVSIENVVRGIGVSHVTVIRPYNIKKSIEAVKKALNYKGVSVVISKQLCTLYARSLKMHKAQPFYISDKCKNHRNCVNELACPAFYIRDEKVKIDPDMCVGCSICAQICPENAILPLKSEPPS
jgi:indolepyruvate ferredoxin oxidoreductase alpha subunit